VRGIATYGQTAAIFSLDESKWILSAQHRRFRCWKV